MFLILTLLFVLFSVGYCFFSGAILYHLRQYTLPGHPAPRILISLFIVFACFFWLFALYFLLKIPS